MHRLSLLALASSLLFSSCAQYASVSQIRPRFRPVSTTVGALVSAEQCITKGLKQGKTNPSAAIGELLTAAEAASKELARNPKDTGAREAYNFAVARVLGIIQDAKLDPWKEPLRVPAQGGDYILAHKPDPRPGWNPSMYDFTPADQFDITGTYVTRHERKEGVGAPIVAIGKEANLELARKNFGMPRVYYGVTALIRFEGRRAVLAFEDPLTVENVTLGGRSMPLAADFTVPIAVMLAQMNPKKLELARVLQPGKYAETARIARLQPYDPNKTVVLVVHGLMDSPATWAPMINYLRADPQIRQRYQFWFYSYPSGYPYPYSASILRQELDAVQKRFPLRKKMVVIGHSMGGCISRLLITDPGDKLWMGAFQKPPEQVPLPAETKQIYRDALIFNRRPEVGRVIFISAPLRGSDLATNWIGRLGSSLVKSPATLVKAGKDALSVVTLQPGYMNLRRIPTSVDTLAPNNYFVRAINTIPLVPDVPHNVICGDRGKGGNKDKTKPVMSDGVVPYWSSHLDTAQSELIVPSSHSAHQHPKAIAEVQRILRAHGR